MLEEVVVRRAADGKIYAVHKKEDSRLKKSTVGAIVAYIACLLFLYGLLSFGRPELIEIAFSNPVALFSLVLGAGVAVVVFTVQLSLLGSATFQKVSSAEGRVKLGNSLGKLSAWIIKATTGISFATVDEVQVNKEIPTQRDEVREEHFSYGAAGADTPFEKYISKILRSLAAHAEASENTASKLLDKGVAFMAGGIVFYVLAIVLWQVFKNILNPDEHIMYVGMAACSMTFVVIEFLAAWFFKQYRYYVEISLACLRVRSVYDRFLLGYYAVREFDSEEKLGACEKMVAMLEEDVKWPTPKSAIETDFNYMLESMSSAHTSIEKLKGIFRPAHEVEKAPEKPSVVK